MFRVFHVSQLSRSRSVLFVILLGVVVPGMARSAANSGERIGNPGDATPAVLTVGPDKQAQYSSIQAALDAAPVRATVRIAPGVYRESIKIDKSVKLIGAGWNRTKIVCPVDVVQALTQLRHDMDMRMASATSDDQRRTLAAEFQAKARDLADRQTLLVSNADGVTIQGLAFSSPGVPLEVSSVPIPVVRVSQTRVHMSACVVIDCPGDGIHVADGSRAEIRHCLVAAVWGTGIVVGDRDGPRASAQVIDCDVRNCHYAGLRIRPGCDASTIIQGCRISGAAWHGIRYDNASPKVIGNLVFGNARCGIYASGDTAALVQGNLFYQNEMDGMSCWSGNHDTVEKNTFAGNLREAMAVVGPCPVLVRNNIFFDHPKAIIYHTPTSESEAEPAGPQFTDNLFWDNQINVERSTRPPDSQEIQTREIPLADWGDNRVADPQFNDAEHADFALPPASPARHAGIGTANPLALQSPWPLQPAERAIIPDSDTRDYRQWKRPTVTTRAQQTGARTDVSERRTETRLKPEDLPNVLLLYHRDPEVRIETVKTLCANGGPDIIDDLIRANSVENYTPVHNAYDEGLRTLTGQQQRRDKGQWKAWLVSEVKAGRLQIDYLPLDLNQIDADQRDKILPFALRLGPVHFQEMVSTLHTQARDQKKLYQALSYMVANDHDPAVQTFLGSDWLSHLFEQGDGDINVIAYLLNGLANPGPLRDKINAQVRACLDHENPVVVANALHLLAGVKGFSTVFTVPGVKAKVSQLVAHKDKQVALQARRALERISGQAATDVSADRPAKGGRVPTIPKPLVQVSEQDRQLPLQAVYDQARQLAQTPDQRDAAVAKYLAVLEIYRSNERIYGSALRDLAQCYEDAGLTEEQIRFFIALAYEREHPGQEALREIFQRFSRKRPALVQAIFAEMRGDSGQQARARPALPDHDLAQGILQRKDQALRQKRLDQLRDMLAPASTTEQKQSGLATLRMALTAKFDRTPFRPLVLPLLEADDDQIRSLALFCVPALNGTADDLPRIIPLAEDSSAEVRGQVGAALITLGQGDHPDQVIPALTKLLQDTEEKVVERTLRSMWGQYSSPEFDALLIELSKDSKHHGSTIYNALSTMHSKSVPVCRRLIEELGESDWNDSGRAAWGLTYGVVDEAKPLVEQGLLAALPEETNEYTRSQEFRALRNVATERSRTYLQSVVDSSMETDKYKQLAREILQELNRRERKRP